MTNIFHRFADEMEKKFEARAKEKGYSLEPWEHYPVKSNGKEIPKPIGYNQIRSLNFKK